jgi:cobalt/nickel transport system ATP-binding protein
VTAPLIEVRDLHYQYEDGTVALDGVDFSLSSGETVALLGANGSGKTTFALHLVGLLSGQGEISVRGLSVKKRNFPEIRKRVGILFQDADEQLFMPTVLEDVAFGPLNLGLSEQDARQRAERMLARVGMSHVAGKAPYHLSAGEKRRVALAGVLAMEPEILILDEPTTFLDPPGQRELVELLRSLPQAKLLVTHDIPFAMSLASRAVFFDKGRITEDGPLRDVVRNRHWQASAE